jgi:hypothetical protein
LERLLSKYPFNVEETTRVSEMTAGGPQIVRVFSRRGAVKVAALSNSPHRYEVVEAIFDQLENRGRRKPAQIGVATQPPTLEMVQTLDEVKRLHLQGALTADIIDEFLTGQRAPVAEESMLAMAAEWEEAQQAMAATQATFRDIDRRAIRCGYGQGAVKRFVQRRKKMQQPQLAFAGTEEDDGT